MMRLLRWSYLVPRLIVLLLAVICSERGLALLLRCYAQQAGQAAVGAKVDIRSARASLFGAHATLEGIAVADPRRPMANLLEAERLTLDFDSASALRKKGVVDQGTLSGLRFGTPRASSGELPQQEIEEDQADSSGISLAGLPGSKVTQQWLNDVQQRFAADLQLESVRQAKQLRKKWPAQYTALESRATQLTQDIRRLSNQVKIARENPLRNVEFLQSVPSRIAKLKSELVAVEQRLKQLPSELQADRAAVLAARELDEQMLREKLNFALLDADSLSAYLLGERLAGPMSELVGWLRWARKLAPSGDVAQQTRGWGVDVLFAGCKRSPDLLVRSLKLDGATRVAGRPFEFRGELTGPTTQPRVLGAPMRLSLATAGAAPMEIRATIDRSREVAVDELIADCPTFALPRLNLGNEEQLGLSVEPSTASLSVSLMLTGDQLSGDVQLVQRNVRMTPHVKPSFAGSFSASSLEQALAKRLSQTPQLVTGITLSGQLDSPTWRVWSTAGPAVAEAMSSALKKFAADKTRSLLAQGQQAVATELGALDREIKQMSTLVSSALGEPAGALQTLSGLGGAKATGVIGSRLTPIGSLFK